MHQNFGKESNSTASIEADVIDKKPDGFIRKNKVYLVIRECKLLNMGKQFPWIYI